MHKTCYHRQTNVNFFLIPSIKNITADLNLNVLLGLTTRLRMALKSRHNHFDVSASALKYFCLFRRLGAVFFFVTKATTFFIYSELKLVDSCSRSGVCKQSPCGLEKRWMMHAICFNLPPAEEPGLQIDDKIKTVRGSGTRLWSRLNPPPLCRLTLAPPFATVTN